MLWQDASPAKSNSERLMPSKDLQKTLDVLREALSDTSSKEEREGSEFSKSLVYPYLELYHQK
jgi:hypothetical protein